MYINRLQRYLIYEPPTKSLESDVESTFDDSDMDKNYQPSSDGSAADSDEENLKNNARKRKIKTSKLKYKIAKPDKVCGS